MMRQRLLTTAAILIGLWLIGCADRSDSFLNPSVVGRWEHAPTSLQGGTSAPQPELSEQRGGKIATVAESDYDEVWVIAKPQAAAAEAVDDDTPGTGAMLAVLPGQTDRVPMPLEHTEVDARIDAYIATVDVTQRFHNPYDTKIEAVYVFPLPRDAAVNEFVMTIGERRIRGIIREREEAERIYHAARAQGHRAALLTQQRPNVFTQKIANIEPGKRIDVSIRYFNTLAYEDGWYAFVFPMVVGPRFNPPGTADPIRTVPRRGRFSDHAHGTNVQYLAANERSGHDIALRVILDPGVEIEQIESANHPIDVSDHTVTLASSDTLPNGDFVLRYRVAGRHVKSNLLTHEDNASGGGYFTLMVYPPAELDSMRRRPMEMVFVIDCSGSMNGEPIAQAKAAIEHTLHQLGPDDTFQIIRFSNDASALGDEPLPATRDNIREGIRYVRSLHGRGGTMMIEGIKAALDFPHDPRRLRFVCFMTDGYIGNEAEILGEMHGRMGPARVFSFGVGSAPNRFLLERMAGLGRGAVAYVGLREDPRPIMDRFFHRVCRPAMTDVTIDWGAMRVGDVFPSRPADLFIGRPIVLTGRYHGALPDMLRITGQTGGEPVTLTIPIDPAERDTPRPSLANVWARRQIAALADRQTLAGDPHGELAHEIQRLALDHNLISAYTAFVAVDAADRTAGSFGTTVQQAVPVPEGVRYDTTVTE